MKVLLTSPINPISNSPYSHRSAQGEIYAQMLRSHEYDEVVVNYGNKIKNLEDYDHIFVYHGNEWQGTLNLFGGPAGISDKEGLVKLFNLPVDKVTSIAIPMPDYPALLKRRLKDGEKFGNILDDLPDNIQGREYNLTALTFEKDSTKLVVGDSHAISMYRPGWDVLSIPFKTLYGAMNKEYGIKDTISERMPLHSHYNEWEFYFGSIDIRHHLGRRKDPLQATEDLVVRYINDVSTFPGKKTICESLPIENVSRKLPKTGYYKGLPYYGSWEERDAIRKKFRDTLLKVSGSDIEVKIWTQYLENEKGELDFSHMERPKSVHLARASYPHWTGIHKEELNTLENFF